MADNFTTNAGSGGDTFAADDISSVKYPRTKIIHGGDGVNDGDVSKTNPLPVGGNTVKDGSGTLLCPVVDSNGYLQVDVIDVTPTAAANSLTKAVDAAFGGSDIVVAAGVVRDDALSTLTPADGDYTVLRVDSTGALWTAVTNFTPGTGASSLGKAEDAAHNSGDVGVQMLAVRKDTAASTAGTDGDYQPPITDSSGRLWVNASGAAIPVTDNSGALTVDNGGTFAVQDSQVIADDAAFTPATSKVFASGFFADETATDSVDEGDAGAARMTLDRKQIVALYPHTAGGCSIYHVKWPNNTTGVNIKNAAGQVYGIEATSVDATPCYVKLYNTAGAPTVGTDTPVMVIRVPGNTAGAGIVIPFPHGVAFATGIGIGVTTGVADNDTTAPTANEVIVNLMYK